MNRAERIGHAILNMPHGSTLTRNREGGWKWQGPKGQEYGYYVRLEDAIGDVGWRPCWPVDETLGNEE